MRGPAEVAILRASRTQDYTAHVTINANGDMTAYVDNFKYTCK